MLNNLMKKVIIISLIITLFIFSISLFFLLSYNSRMDVAACEAYCSESQYEYSACIPSSWVKLRYFQNMDKIRDGDDYIARYEGIVILGIVDVIAVR
jgi:hypothetical protein